MAHKPREIDTGSFSTIRSEVEPARAKEVASRMSCATTVARRGTSRRTAHSYRRMRRRRQGEEMRSRQGAALVAQLVLLLLVRVG